MRSTTKFSVWCAFECDLPVGALATCAILTERTTVLPWHNESTGAAVVPGAERVLPNCSHSDVRNRVRPAQKGIDVFAENVLRVFFGLYFSS